MRKVDAAKRSSDGGLQKRAAGGNAGGIAGRKGHATRMPKAFSVMVAMLLVVLLIPGVAMGRGLLGGLLDGLTGGGQAASEASNTAGSTAASSSAGAVVGSTSAGVAAGSGGVTSAVGSANPGDLFGSSAATGTSGEAGLASASGVTAKSSVNDYTWDELSAIGDEIAATDSEESAIEVAKKYNLCTPEGKLDGTQTKSLTLTDGTQTSVQIAGFYHDDASTGYGKAGITFIFTDAVAQEPMYNGNGNSDGWTGADIRSWLASDFRDELPADLIAKLVTVNKVSNDISMGIVSPVTTQDELWLFSSTELGGTIAWWSDQSAYNDMLNAEGTEYQLFSDCGVSNNDSCAILSKTYGGSPVWW